jgi:hypothetical protein
MTFENARITLQWATQLVAAAGASLAEPKPDASHTTATWLAKHDALAGQLVGRRAALRFRDLELLVLDASDAIVASRSLSGVTLADALEWLGSTIARRKIERPVHDLPDHPVAHGATFSIDDRASFEEVGRWFAAADTIVRAVADRERGASPVRCWPHHFDTATLISLADDRSIGVGFSPGDASYGEPYFYVTPWPYPKSPGAHVLAEGGKWHVEGWFGAVLLGTREPQRVNAFLDSAVTASRALLVSA